MGSEGAPDDQEPVSADRAQTPRPMSARRKKRLAIAIAVMVVALVVVIWGWSSTGGSFLDVSSVVDSSSTSVPDEYLGKLDIRGVVSEWSGGADLDFALLDTEDSSKSISVTVSGTIPEGFENGKTIVAKGYLDESLPLHMTASEITVGCSSKY